MGVNLANLIGGQTLTGIIQDPRGGLPTNQLPPQLFAEGRTTTGDQGKFRRVHGTRQTARAVQYGSPARTRNLRGVTEVSVKLIHSFEEHGHDPLLLQRLMDPAQQVTAAQEVGSQVREFRQLFQNLRVAAIISAFSLRTGANIHFDGDGNVLPTSSGAAYSVDFEVPAGNKNQLDWDGNGAIIDAAWSGASSDITAQVKELRAAAIKTTGYPVEHAIYGENVPEYLLSNNTVKELVVRNPRMNEAFSQGMIPDGLLGLRWWPGYLSFFEDEEGTVQPLIGADDVTFLPTPDPTWYELLRGTMLVPTGLGQVTQEATQMLNSLRQVAGQFSYAAVTHNPPGVRQFAGDTFLPVVKVPRSVWYAQVAGF